MPPILISTQNIAPNLHPNRQNSSTYFSYIRRYARQCNSAVLPPTMREFERCMRRSEINILGSGFGLDYLPAEYNMDIIIDSLLRTDISAIFSRDHYSSNTMAMVKLLAAMNIWANVARGYCQRVCYKVDFIQTVGTRAISDSRIRSWDTASRLARVRPRFNDRCILRITDQELQFFRSLLGTSRSFLREAGILYNALPDVSVFRSPRHEQVDQSASRRPRRPRGVGGQTGRRRERRLTADDPNGHLAHEYVERTEDDDSMPQNQLVTMLQGMHLEPEVRNQIHSLLIAVQLGNEETAEVATA